jgi:selenocysteine-specific elongation factor
LHVRLVMWELQQDTEPCAAQQDARVRLLMGPAHTRAASADWCGCAVQEKTKEGSIERILPDGCTAICKGMFKKETDLSVFEGLQVRTGAGEVGCIEGRFGSSGKVRVGFTAALTAPRAPQNNRITLSYKRYVFDESSSRHRLQQ